MKIECGTHIGAVRKSNQDACDCGVLSENAVWAIVCDGMGGANGGNIASVLALETARTYISEKYEDSMSAEDIEKMLTEAVDTANEVVYNKAGEDEELLGMGTTVVIMMVVNENLHVVHVGDSRAYLKTQDKIVRVTKDHSFVQNLVDFGQITEIEAKTHPNRNIITRVVGVHESVICDYVSIPMQPGETALACSDGLTSYVSDELLEEYINGYTGKELIDLLIQYAIDAGGSDNITVATIHREEQ